MNNALATIQRDLTGAQEAKAIPASTFLLGYVGSIAHGVYTPTYGPDEHDDKDLLGIYVAPRPYYIGLGRGKYAQSLFMEPGISGTIWDITIYEVRKMFSLLLKCNPNVISLLWLPDDLYVTCNRFGEVLRDNRDIFSSQLAANTFCGYARGQLKRMTAASTGKLGLKRKGLVEQFGCDTKEVGRLVANGNYNGLFLTDALRCIFRDYKEVLTKEQAAHRLLKDGFIHKGPEWRFIDNCRRTFQHGVRLGLFELVDSNPRRWKLKEIK